MPGVITLKFSLIKNGVVTLAAKSPIFIPGPVEPQFGPGRYIYFEGFSVDSDGKQHYMDASVAYKQTSLRAIEYLRRFGYSDYQLYLLLGCAPVQGHVAGIVDVSLAPGYWDRSGLLLTVVDRCLMLARRWGSRLIFSILISSLMRALRRKIWELVLLLAVECWANKDINHGNQMRGAAKFMYYRPYGLSCCARLCAS